MHRNTPIIDNGGGKRLGMVGDGDPSELERGDCDEDDGEGE